MHLVSGFGSISAAGLPSDERDAFAQVGRKIEIPRRRDHLERSCRVGVALDVAEILIVLFGEFHDFAGLLEFILREILGHCYLRI